MTNEEHPWHDEIFLQVRREHEEICTDPYVCIDEERGCLMVIKEEAERRKQKEAGRRGDQK